MAVSEKGASLPSANAMAAAAAATCEKCGAVWCSVVQCGAVWCSVVQCGSVWGSVLQYMQLMCIGQTYWQSHAVQCGAMWGRVGQCVAVYAINVYWSNILAVTCEQRVAVRCNALQCLLQCVAVCASDVYS